MSKAKDVNMTGQCQSKVFKEKEKQDAVEVTYHIFLKSEGTQINIETKDKKLHDDFTVGAEYEIKATTTQATLD